MNDLSYQFISVFIAISIPLLFVAFMLDDYKSKRIILYFCWGVFAGALAFNINNLLGDTAEQAERMALSIAPMIEEICKGLPVLLFLNKKKYPHITKLVIVCALASGIGFSIQESIYYFDMSSREAYDIFMLISRTLSTSLMHGVTTTILGIGLFLTQKGTVARIPVILGLFALCTSIHALFNLLLQTHLAFIAMIMPFAMFIPVLLWLRTLESDESKLSK